MFEVMSLVALLFMAGLVVGVIALVAGFFRLVVKLLVLPFALIVLFLKGLALLVAVLLLLAVASPVILVLMLPLLFLAGLVWGAVALLSRPRKGHVDVEAQRSLV